MAKPFAEVTSRTQVRRLRELARTALPEWGLEGAELRLLNHGYNTTFRVDTLDGRRFALRINMMAFKTQPLLLAEVSWLAALSAETDLHVPTPQPTRDGAWSAQVHSADLGRELPVVLFHWLEGRNLGSRPTPAQLRAVGEAAAMLHEHAATWTMPAGAELPLFDNVLTDLPNRLGDHPALSRCDSEVLMAAYHRAQQLQDEAFAADRIIPLHADLHGENLKWVSTGSTSGALSVFDFDDAGLGVPALDLAIAAYYLRDDAELEDALLTGYAARRALPPFTAEQFEGMVAGRNLLLVNDIIDQPNAGLQAMTPAYVAASVRRLQHWLDSGRYRREPPDEAPPDHSG